MTEERSGDAVTYLKISSPCISAKKGSQSDLQIIFPPQKMFLPSDLRSKNGQHQRKIDREGEGNELI